MEQLSCIIDRIMFYNEDNGYCVSSVIPEEQIHLSKEQYKHLGSRITVVGIVDRKPYEDEKYTFEGEYVKDPKFGFQFKFSSFSRQNISSRQGIISYLSSELFDGIGIKTAESIVNNLGNKAIEKIKKDPKVLEKLNLSVKQRSSIIEGIALDEVNQFATIFLLDHGITMEMAHKILKAMTKYKVVNIIDSISENPYQLIDMVDRFGFKKADALALSLGISKSADVRLRSLIKYVLNELLYSCGNSYVSKSELLSAINKYSGEVLSNKRFLELLDFAVKEQKIYIDINENIFEYNAYLEEVELASTISRLIKSEDVKRKKYSKKKIEEAFNIIKAESNIEYNDLQIEAIKKAFVDPMVIITGSPGTGKSTIIHAILKMYSILNNNNQLLVDNVALLAPTGRAAKRLSETTNMQTSTIHKFLGYTGEGHFAFNEYVKTNAKLIIVDESSMVDTSLAYHLFTSMQPDARVILVGDVDQLPSVGPGQVLKDLIDSALIPVIRLTKIHRQAEDSTIISLARSVNQSMIPMDILERKHDRMFVEVDKKILTKIVIDAYTKQLEIGTDIHNLQVLIPMYKCLCGINEINTKIQEVVNPDGEQIKHYGRTFRVGDKVIQLVNRADKGIMNGDIGFINSFVHEGEKVKKVNVLYDNMIVDYTFDELEDISLAYAISIHKSQGSEFEKVILPFSSSYNIMLKKKLIYTAITRAKKALIMVGEISALKSGICKLELERKTILKERLCCNSNNIVDIKEVLKSIENSPVEDELGAIEIDLNKE